MTHKRMVNNIQPTTEQQEGTMDCYKILTRHLAALAVLLASAFLFSFTCVSPTPAPAPAPPYSPKFTYSVQKAAAKLDVTVGLVAPQFAGEGTTYWTNNKRDDVAKALIGGLRASFNELLVGKGFNVTGPFDSVENMTFPEKKGADFVLFPEMDVSADVKAENPRPHGVGENAFIVCDTSIAVGGNVSLVVKEPLSGEKMWVKRIEIPAEKKVLGQAGCVGGQPTEQTKAEQTFRDEWGRAHEALYSAIMRGLDKHVNGEEFQTLKKQSAELREKKKY